ncbi:MAG: tRNA (N(6)-L-threonylcarbamoyladenosine(37)-C(2))-methylthiotransferase MtaB [Hyphomicrobiaceae bacterium]
MRDDVSDTRGCEPPGEAANRELHVPTPETAGPQVITLGCRLNAYESEVMKRNAIAAGLSDAVIVNTCAVTQEAIRQAGQTIRRLRRERPGVRIIVTGCAAQIEPERFANMEAVDHVVGNAEKLQAETFRALAVDHLPRVSVNDIMSVRETAAHMIDGIGSRARAYVQVQNGCDHRCTFCVIPFGRGPSRSVPAGDVVREIRRLVDDRGFAEIVLTGVDITSWGHDLPGAPKLGRLVRQILRAVPGLARLRLSSIDQVEADGELMRALGEEERLMPHLHLSMQSGSDLILKRMKRRHVRADAVRFCEEARALRPDIAFGADLIAGFPTETEELFDATASVIDECGLSFVHVFPYSPRPGTPAARMPQVDRRTVKERAQRLRAVADAALSRYLSAQVGTTAPVLMERATLGRTPQFAEVNLATPAPVGTVVMAAIGGHDGERLSAVECVSGDRP